MSVHLQKEHNIRKCLLSLVSLQSIRGVTEQGLVRKKDTPSLLS